MEQNQTEQNRTTEGNYYQEDLHKGAVLQHPGPGRTFKGLGVAKRYCRRDSIGDSFVQGRKT